MQPKSGFLSSELWLSVAALAIPALSAAFQGSTNPWISLAGMVLAGVYATLRHQLKLDAQQPQPVVTQPNATLNGTPVIVTKA